MLRMALQARVVDPLDARLVLQPFGQARALALCAYMRIRRVSRP